MREKGKGEAYFDQISLQFLYKQRMEKSLLASLYVQIKALVWSKKSIGLTKIKSLLKVQS